jgi:hypothetical protein
MIDKVYIDGQEIQSTWGLVPLYSKFYSTIMKYPDAKDKISVDFEDEDGIEEVHGAPFLKSVEPTISFGVDTYANYLAFCRYMVAHPTFELFSFLVGKKINYEYISHSEFSFYVTGSTFAVKLREANFLNRTNIYLLDENGNNICDENSNRIIV